MGMSRESPLYSITRASQAFRSGYLNISQQIFLFVYVHGANIFIWDTKAQCLL